MHGGPSQVDTFDYKPLLAARPRQAAAVRQAARRFDARPATCSARRGSSSSTARAARGSASCSRTSPSCVDDLCIINVDARLELAARRRRCSNCTPAATRSCGPAWARGSPTGWAPRTRTCPGFITICPTLTHGGVNNWSSAFLPAVYQGTPIGNAAHRSQQAKIPFVENSHTPAHLQRMELDLLARESAASICGRTGPGPRRSRVASSRSSWRSACRSAAPELQDVSDESQATPRAVRARRRPHTRTSAGSA